MAQSISSLANNQTTTPSTIGGGGLGGFLNNTLGNIGQGLFATGNVIKGTATGYPLPQGSAVTGPYATPTTPIKSQTKTNSDGSSTQTTYHAPSSPKSEGTGITQSQVQNNLKAAGFNSTIQTPSQLQAAQSQATPTQPQQPLTQSGLINQAMEAYQNAGTLGQAIGQAEQNENFDATGGIGAARSGLIGANYGLAGQNALTQASGLSGLAGQLAPVTQFGVLTNPITGQPTGGGSASSAAFNGGVTQGQNSAGQNYAGQYQANIAAKGLEGTIQQTIQNNPNLNPSLFTSLNTALQFVNGQVSNPQYQELSNQISEYVSTLAPILGVGGDTTNLKTQIAQGFVNAAANGQSISQVINNIGQIADAKLANLASGGQGGGQIAGGTPQGSTPTSFGQSW